MDRREFMKCGFGFALGISLIPEELKSEVPIKIFNGQVFESPWPLCHTVIVLYFGRGDQWLLLSDPYPAFQGGNATMVCYYLRDDGSDNPIYTQEELQEKLKGWKLTDSRLELSTIGNL